MILFQNSLIKLIYNPATDILSVDMPSVNYDIATEYSRSLDIIVENVKNYDVKKLLIDASKSEIEIDLDKFADLITKFSLDLKASRLEKVSRVVSADQERENIVQQIIEEVQPVPLYNSFTDYKVAMGWLEK